MKDCRVDQSHYMSLFSPVLAAVASALLIMAAQNSHAATGDASGASRASRNSERGSGFVVAGSAAVLGGTGSLVVAAIEPVGESVVITLRTASDAGAVSVEVSATTAREAALSAGTAVSAVAEATGYLLVASGKMLAFIPNEVGRELLHHSRSHGSGI